MATIERSCPALPGTDEATVVSAGTQLTERVRAGKSNHPTPSSRLAPDGYEILGELGRGSMGVVYKARHVALHRLVALKMMLAGAHAGSEGLTRFLDEARVVARLQHPHIVQVYEIRLHDGLPFYAMELIAGGTLADRLGGRPQPFRQAAELVHTLARAIDAAHAQGIVHRDLKPANILLSTDDPPSAGLPFGGVPKITDFGLAKQMEEGAGGQTRSGMVMGTPNYMAPEQAEGKSREVGPAADVYALGAILYEMLTGRPPFIAETPAETVLLLFQTEPVAPSRLQPKLPRDLETVCLKCLHKDPQRRYPTARALADDLQRFLNGEAVAARRPALREQVWKWCRRRPALATLLASAALAAAGLLGLTGWHQADLRARLDQARHEERQARAEQDDALRAARMADLRGAVGRLLGAGEAALAARDWSNAHALLVRAGDRAGSEGELADLRDRAAALLARADRQQAARARLRQFQRRRHEALFHATLFTGSDLASALDDTRTAARQALALFGPGTEDDACYEVHEQAEIRSGRYELLLVLAEAVAQPLPNQPEAERRRQARAALALLDQAAGLGLRTRAFAMRRAQYLAQAGETHEAARARQRAEATRPADALDHFLIGDVRYRQGDWAGAAESFREVLQRQPDHFWALYYLALCRLKGRQSDLAEAGLTACLSLRPDFPWLYLLRGSARGELGRFAAAEADFKAALRGDLPRAARYALFVNRGVLRVRQGQADAAIADLRAAVALNARPYQGHLNLAQAYLAASRADAAVGQLDEALRREPGLAVLHRTRARAHLRRGDEAAALADLDQAVRLDAGVPSPALAEDHAERARLLHRQGDDAAAVRACDQALAAHPGHARVYRLRAEALLRLERLPEALTALDACVKQGPADADLFRARATARARLGQYADAQSDYARALEQAPDAATFCARGWTYLVAAAPHLALPDFEAALRLEPACGDAHNGRGLARALLGQPRQAAADADEAVRLGPRSCRTLYNAARVHAQAATRASAAARPTHVQRALALLDAALAELPAAQRPAFWRDSVQADFALAPLRPTASFARLAGRYLPPGR